MDSIKQMKEALDYIESHLTEEIEYPKIAQIALCSQYHFQRMFTFLVGIPLSEYIRRRRLTLAADDLQNTDDKIIDIALKYGYRSADSFSRAFQAIHNIQPSKVREKGVSLKAYPRISFTLSLKGVTEMKYRLETKEAFTVVGIKDRFSHAGNLGADVGKMWATLPEETYKQIYALINTEPHGIVGAYGQMYKDDTTDYYIGAITTSECPENLTKLEVSKQLWVIFEIEGALPDAMKEVWGRVFSEWLPTMGYEHAEAPEIEWYSNGDMSSETYKSEIWIPIIKKI